MKSYCSACTKETNHEVLEVEQLKDCDEDTDVWVQNTYQIISCLGCDNISFREELICSEDIDPNSGEPQPTINLYPKASENTLTAKSITGIPTKIRRIFRETIDCYNNDSFTLCSAGLRAIIDGICADKKINGTSRVDGKTGEPLLNEKTGKLIFNTLLEGKIIGLHKNSILTEHHASILHELRFLGNKAVHELDMPSREELKLSIEIIEHTLHNIYGLKNTAEELQWQIEIRKRTVK